MTILSQIWKSVPFEPVPSVQYNKWNYSRASGILNCVHRKTPFLLFWSQPKRHHVTKGEKTQRTKDRRCWGSNCLASIFWASQQPLILSLVNILTHFVKQRQSPLSSCHCIHNISTTVKIQYIKLFQYWKKKIPGSASCSRSLTKIKSPICWTEAYPYKVCRRAFQRRY